MITTAVMAMTSKTLTTMAAISAAVSLETLTSSNVWAEKKCINLFILSARDLLMLKKKATFWSSQALSSGILHSSFGCQDHHLNIQIC
jgi:hypothetical protein